MKELMKGKRGLVMGVANEKSINPESVYAAAKVIQIVSGMSNNGFDNFRVGVSSNIRPHTPFFPFSVHEGACGFSLALEVVDEFLAIASQFAKEGINVLQEKFVEKLTTELVAIDEIGRHIEKDTGVKYLGIDASLAPLPNGTCSVARLVELIGGEDFGSSGTLFITSMLTDAIKASVLKSGCRNVGFNGVMYSMLEDDYLALRNKQKNVDLNGLLLYSAVCGCGLDMIPVPGDILREELESIIFDTASLAITLNKPLGVRLLPIKQLSFNEITDFNHDFLVDTRVVRVRDKGLCRSIVDSSDIQYLRRI